ncbi:fasciclin domain-containing protein [Engelhardtia mirabilis]|uniref:Immunogenic protein MPT70 n=1 Tax=Engelhardtia mirabilis TaxID=2528011 RepID=A0A518BET4_9BACT|nr:Immunogenic protein MPT70 precursor [Planctomycetes bacterium Pla133]QDU99817.1 Immunogenic protein MPT70 precursor [Planctomycetes bacterium Pla86]
MKQSLLLLASGLLAAAPAAAQGGSQPDIVDALVADGNYTTLVAAVQAAGLVNDLKGPGPLTVFAPDDAAFAKVPAARLNALIANPEALKGVLLYHVVGGELLAADVLMGGDATTLAEKDVTFTANQEAFVNGAKITAVDWKVANGVIHTIDNVLNPAQAPIDIFDAVAGQPNFTTLKTAIEVAGLKDALKGDGPLTLFAPTNRAFEKLPAGVLQSLLANPTQLADVLLYHVVGGEVLSPQVVAGGTSPTLLANENVIFNGTPLGAFVDDARILVVDIPVQNGVIHVIDAVLTPPSPNLVEMLVALPDFDTLVTAVGIAGLGDTLANGGPFTVFAPADFAFDAVRQGSLEALLASPTELAKVLQYHVIAGEFFAADVLGLNSASTLIGQDVTFSVQGPDVFVNGNKIIGFDVVVGNGVIHFIDGVLFPQ